MADKKQEKVQCFADTLKKFEKAWQAISAIAFLDISGGNLGDSVGKAVNSAKKKIGEEVENQFNDVVKTAESAIKNSGISIDKMVGASGIDDIAGHAARVRKATTMTSQYNPKAMTSSMGNNLKDLGTSSKVTSFGCRNLRFLILQLDAVVESVDHSKVAGVNDAAIDAAILSVEELEAANAQLSERMEAGALDNEKRIEVKQGAADIVRATYGNTIDFDEMMGAVKEVTREAESLKVGAAEYLEEITNASEMPDNLKKSTFKNDLAETPKMTNDLVAKAKTELESAKLEKNQAKKKEMVQSAMGAVQALSVSLDRTPADIPQQVQNEPEYATIESLSQDISSKPTTNLEALATSMDEVASIANTTLVKDLSGGLYAQLMAPHIQILIDAETEANDIGGSVDSSGVADEIDSEALNDLYQTMAGSGLDSLKKIYSDGKFDKIALLDIATATVFNELSTCVVDLINFLDSDESGEASAVSATQRSELKGIAKLAGDMSAAQLAAAKASMDEAPGSRGGASAQQAKADELIGRGNSALRFFTE
jgi:hypothetical protein